MNLKHKNDVNVIGDSIGIGYKNILNKLPIGYGIVKLQGRYFEPFQIKIPLKKLKEISI